MEIKPINIKPIQIQGVAPVKVQPIAQVTSVTPVQQTEPQTDDVFNQLFGTTPESEVKPATEVTKEERQAEIKAAAQKVDSKNKKPKQVEASGDEEEQEEKKVKTKKAYDGPREIRVYGQTLWTETDPKVTLEQIRKKIVDEYHYPEFSAERTNMSLDEKTGIVVPFPKFEKKG